MKTNDNILLNRDTFRNSVFERDEGRCVICKEIAVDSHHLIERRLFKPSGLGYDINNGASLCEKHHLQAEMTTLSCDEIRQAAGITEIVLPEHLYVDVEYDKWGNEILRNGMRIKGELFNDSSVQKILGEGNVLSLFTDLVKYPRTFHLPWSPGMNRDDRMMTDVKIFEGQEVMICEKLDGENSNLNSTRYHARSFETEPHPSRNWVKGLWSQKGYNIPEGWRVYDEIRNEIEKIDFLTITEEESKILLNRILPLSDKQLKKCLDLISMLSTKQAMSVKNPKKSWLEILDWEKVFMENKRVIKAFRSIEKDYWK